MARRKLIATDEKAGKPQPAKRGKAAKVGLTRQQLAAMFGVNTQQFDRRFRPHIPDRLVIAAGTGQRALFQPECVRAICDAMVAAERDKARIADDDMLLSGPSDSDPELRRYRLAKAKLAELELEVKRGELVPADTAGKVLGVVAAKLRRLGERLAKKHGRQVGEAIEDVLGEAEADLERSFGSTDEDNADDEA